MGVDAYGEDWEEWGWAWKSADEAKQQRGLPIFGVGSIASQCPQGLKKAHPLHWSVVLKVSAQT